MSKFSSPFVYELALVAHGTPAYDALVALRYEVLRRPLGLAFTPEQLAAESGLFHLACCCEGVLAGGLVLLPLPESRMQMRQVAVREDWRGKGAGRALVEYAEEWARQAGANVMMLHARESAVGFYETLGYQKRGARFWEVGLAHWEMTKTLRGDGQSGGA